MNMQVNQFNLNIVAVLSDVENIMLIAEELLWSNSGVIYYGADVNCIQKQIWANTRKWLKQKIVIKGINSLCSHILL